MEASSASIEADIARLETRLRELKIQYDMFFNGALPREPFELRADVERLIRRHSGSPIRKYAQRFHFNSLVSRFNSLSELWSKTIRTLEEGDRPAPGSVGRGPTEKVLTSCRLHDPIKEQELLRFVRYALWKELREGKAAPRPAFDRTPRSARELMGPHLHPTGADWALPWLVNSVVAYLELGYISNDRDLALLTKRIEQLTAQCEDPGYETVKLFQLSFVVVQDHDLFIVQLVVDHVLQPTKFGVCEPLRSLTTVFGVEKTTGHLLQFTH